MSDEIFASVFFDNLLLWKEYCVIIICKLKLLRGFMKNKTAAATAAILIVEIIFGFSFLFSKTAMNFASPFVLIADRFSVAFIGLTVVMLVTKTKIRIGKDIWKPIVMAMFQPVLYFIFESYGIKMTTSSFSGVMISLIPIVSMIAGIFVLHEFPSALQYLFCGISVGGVVIMTLSGKSEGIITPLGVVCLFLAVVSCVAFNITSRKLSESFTVFERTYAMTAAGALIFNVLALIENKGSITALAKPLEEPAFLVSVLYLGGLSSVVAFMLQNYSNTYLPVAKTSVFAGISTMVSVLAGVIFLHEKMTFFSVIAIIMIISGVMGVQLLDGRKIGRKGK